MELWDLYDHHMTKTGETHERGKPVPEGRYHMVVHVAIFNDQGEMLIQQRQPFKAGWPNMWDITCGGSATAGDTSQAAASRELHEELGLEVDFEGERPRLTIHFGSGFDDIYTLIWNVNVDALILQEEEVQAARWASEAEIHRMVDAGEFIPYHHSLISLLFLLSRQRGTVTQRDRGEEAQLK
ncbi:MAG: NUDIX domain-containing protein [Clostridia bacterium]|nr:NUDIX domain-containing protein [Clostridia bacterium]